MSQKLFNIYFIASLVFFAVMFLTAFFDAKRMFIDSTPYLFTLLLSLINMGFAIYLFNQPVTNYFQDKEEN